MANTKEIKDHIASVSQTQKITNAMYLISSTKMERARRDLDRTRPYFSALRQEIRQIFRSYEEDIDSRYFYPDKDDADCVYGCLVITADRGLAGSYNQNVIRLAEHLREEHAETRFFVVGEYGRHYFMQHGIPIEQSFLYTAQNPTMQRARDITGVMLGQFDEGELDKLFIAYTDMKNQMTEEAHLTRALPFHREVFVMTEEEEKSPDLEFLPSVTEVMEAAMRSYAAGYVYSALVDSFCCEQNARMRAMKSANDNAAEILDELSMEYNRVRQADITQQITEVSAGAKAQAVKRAKRGREASGI